MADNEEVQSESSSTRRRVYDLPTDLVDRILLYQKEKGLPSEVEAARKLLDQALKGNENVDDLVRQVVLGLEANEDPNTVATKILAGHPKVASIHFKENYVMFTFLDKADEETISIHSRDRINVDGDPNVYGLEPLGPGGKLIIVNKSDEIPF